MKTSKLALLLGITLLTAGCGITRVPGQVFDWNFDQRAPNYTAKNDNECKSGCKAEYGGFTARMTVHEVARYRIDCKHAAEQIKFMKSQLVMPGFAAAFGMYSDDPDTNKAIRDRSYNAFVWHNLQDLNRCDSPYEDAARRESPRKTY